MRSISRQEFHGYLRDRPLNLWKKHSVMRVKPCLLQHDGWLLFSNIWFVVMIPSAASDWTEVSSLPQRLRRSTTICARRTFMQDSVAGVNSMAIGES
jgi:hypothetical protein